MQRSESPHTWEEMLVSLVRNGGDMFGCFLRTGRGVFSARLAGRYGAPDTVDDLRSWMIDSGNVEAGSEESWLGLFSAIGAGDRNGAAMLSMRSEGGGFGRYWLRFDLVMDERGEPLMALITVDDFTELYKRFRSALSREHTWAEENRQLRENEYLLRLTAQHSDRNICLYDVDRRMSRKWDLESCDDCKLPRLCEMDADAVLKSGGILPESLDELSKMFSDIAAGRASGSMKLRANTSDGERRWFDIKYTTICDDAGRPVSAIISHEDITEQHEHEVAYRRLTQQLSSYAEENLLYIVSDLSADSIEELSGQMLPTEERDLQCSHSDFGRRMLDRKFLYEDREEASRYFSSENLLNMYYRGERQLKSEWRVRFQDGSCHWLDTHISIIADPYTGNIKAFIRMLDITAEKRARLEIQQRSERDGMTGLLNRATAEERVRELVADVSRPGILILLDLDDLKSINDTFGHKQGDRALIGIAEMLKSHFRESDVIARIGGDEFLVYLPGAAVSGDAIAASLTSLLRRLSGISIGPGDERRIHCSIGCSVQDARTDTYEVLSRQADTALYHVKRSGKNNFAFYVPEMEQADFQFRAQKLLSQQGEKKFQPAELQYLLSAIAALYPLVFSANLSVNDYYLMENGIDEVFEQLPTFGRLDNVIEAAAGLIHADDVEGFRETLSGRALLEAYERGETTVRHYFRFLYRGEHRWTEATAILYTNDSGDVCDFTLLRWASERSYELDQMWLKKVLDLAVITSFEYICLINLDTGEYFLYGDEKNTHNAPRHGSFDDVTRYICERFIAPEKREEYYRRANLDAVGERMREDGGYTYDYAMPDGARRAAFHWFEPTQTRVLMTVQRL